MSSVKRIVCLAASYKTGGTCVAGKELKKGTPGAWIRPVSDRAEHELSISDMRFENGKSPKLLDMLSIQMLEPLPHRHQVENHLIDAQWYWVKEGTFPSSQLHKLVDSPASLWVNGYESRYGINDEVPEDELDRGAVTSSLYLIKPANLSIGADREWGTQKVRASFRFKGEHYKLMITDPGVRNMYLSAFPEVVIKRSPLLCISLTQPFKGKCYKLVAGVLNYD